MGHTTTESVQTLITCDVLVVGGGPAGSTISTLLAEQGWNVHILEKDPHPRFHIGESLLPQSLPVLKRLGVLPEVEQIGIIKYGAEMISHRYGRSQMFYFAKAFDESQPYAFEVKRSEFDAILLKNAITKGVTVHEGVKAQRVEFRPGQSSLVHTEDREGRPANLGREVCRRRQRPRYLSLEPAWRQAPKPAA